MFAATSFDVPNWISAIVPILVVFAGGVKAYGSLRVWMDHRVSAENEFRTEFGAHKQDFEDHVADDTKNFAMLTKGQDEIKRLIDIRADRSDRLNEGRP